MTAKDNTDRSWSEKNRSGWKDSVDCKKAESMIGVYLAGGLAGEELSFFTHHIDNCPHCHGLLANQELIDKALAQTLTPRVDPGYWDKLWPRIQVSLAARKKTGINPILRWVFATAGALAGAASLFVFLISRPAQAPVLATHEAAYFSKLPSSPPILLEENEADMASSEIAVLTMGNPTPNQRVSTWKRLEGF